MSPEQDKERRDLANFAAEKTREEFRNAARKALTEEGFTKDLLRQMAQSMVAEAVSKALEGAGVATIVERIVRKMIAEQIPGKDAFGKAVHAAVQAEAAALAKDRVAHCLRISFKDDSGTPSTPYANGGSF